MTLGATAISRVKTENAAMQVIRLLRRPNRSVIGPIGDRADADADQADAWQRA